MAFQILFIQVQILIAYQTIYATMLTSVLPLIWINLRLLGYDWSLSADPSLSAVLKHTLDSAKRHGLSKSLEKVVFFLIFKIDPSQGVLANTSLCSTRESRLAAAVWLEQLKKDHGFSKNVTVRKSCFDDCHSERYLSPLVFPA